MPSHCALKRRATSGRLFQSLLLPDELRMSFAHLLNTGASLATFRQAFDIPEDVNVAYCQESEIALHRGSNIAFFPLMAILEGRVRFPVNPLLLDTLRFYDGRVFTPDIRTVHVRDLNFVLR
ncbi:hypothetical protein SO802_014475 [Lithocarpus litseifolius]|uniref:Uncharacterized protein n=1 Tax=Lithocarpus litseifolius TaxID=425828 RepID=A0AAW2CS99_9ROSI